MLYPSVQAKIKHVGKNILCYFCEYFYGVSSFDASLNPTSGEQNLLPLLKSLTLIIRNNYFMLTRAALSSYFLADFHMNMFLSPWINHKVLEVLEVRTAEVQLYMEFLNKYSKCMFSSL